MTDFIETLRRRLAAGLPGETAQYLMAPPARPRPSEPLPGCTPQQQSAVLIYLYPVNSSWRLVLMKRTAYDGPHGGQVSIPGGRLEPGETHEQAALREFEEETGVCVGSDRLLGRLSGLFIPSSNFLVQPFVAHAEVRPQFAPDPIEVEAILELTIPMLLNAQTVRRGRVDLTGGVRVEAPYFDVHGHRVWGATAMILSELREVLRGGG